MINVAKIRSGLTFLMIGLFFIFLAGCGFHLKGTQSVSVKTISPVYENVSATFRQSFQQVLENNAWQVIDAESADVSVVFLKGFWQRQSLTVTDTGIPAEYRLSYTLRYRFTVNGVEKYREIVESRDLKSNNAQLLAIDSQQAYLKRQIQKRISQLVIRHFSRI